ncbi:protein pangolin, isoforms A/H/I/S-like isoform X2 [Haliotis cracherodii]|uniref:protein pangolin, isoforms A/H/I/S-like isoform X4 n=1 Tax=Haliotis rufescens TaxID=6454 RepID=UPI001EB02E14|nr:protein pangolin, isoforms A/H/I/S-like isoform X4 [Haliotis rufescens]
MPHMSSGGSEDFYSKDEVKVYKDEGEEEKRSSENLSEEKLGLVTESEEGKNGSLPGNYSGSEKSGTTRPEDDKSAAQPPGQGQGSLGFIMPPYYANGASMGSSKLGMVQPPYPGLVMYNDFGSPPPAHMGIPPVHTDPKTGLPRPPMYATYPAPPGQFPHHLYPEFSQVQWHRPAGYPISSGGFSGSYPPLINSISRLGPPGILPHPGLPHPGMPPHPIMSPGPKQEMMGAQTMGVDNHRHGNIPDSANSCQNNPNPEPEKKKPHIKKPLNAFMLFMKEMRPKVIAECTLRESAAINQILGRRWHALDRGEQSKYYDMARKEKELHLQLYPGWSARDNYASHAKKKKRKKDGPGENKVYVSECTHAKKCRARFGMEQQTQWCKPCRRKKRCVRFLRGEGEDGGTSDEELDDDLCNDSYAESGRSGVDSDCNVESPLPGPQSDSFHLKPSEKCHNSRHLSSPFGPGSGDALDVDLEEAEKALDFHAESKLCMDLPQTPPSVPTS